ncbi:hypothetical protein TEA_008399 [Camellia sinensis var. sinensis]|uniref:Uncharacterized protein n=1 Tax=Camellia sinensis var. sinensis TaxID=542762 RepID=A0A4V3WR57_CAMSN|nr:hypothetical protein TEA_008399 [Camellia sinensis var. sinensis]
MEYWWNISVRPRLMPTRRFSSAMPIIMRYELVENWVGHILVCLRNSQIKGWTGNLSPVSIIDKRVKGTKPWFPQARLSDQKECLGNLSLQSEKQKGDTTIASGAGGLEIIGIGGVGWRPGWESSSEEEPLSPPSSRNCF